MTYAQFSNSLCVNRKEVKRSTKLTFHKDKELLVSRISMRQENHCHLPPLRHHLCWSKRSIVALQRYTVNFCLTKMIVYCEHIT